MNPPISDLGVNAKSTRLAGCSIGLGIAGGIAAVETVKLTREWRRHGAEVTAFFSPDAKRFITPLSLEWATGRPVIEEAGADVEHLSTFDVVVIAPATLNTIAKAAAGITDTVVGLLLAGQLGRKGKVIVVPTMNEQLAQHPGYDDMVAKLKKWGVVFCQAPVEEGRLKMPAPEKIVEETLRVLGR